MTFKDALKFYSSSRSRALWYELTHDRLTKPIINSNTRWKRKNKTSILQVVMPKLENQIHWYSRKSAYNKSRFQLFQIITLIASAIIPIVNVIDVIDFPVRIISSVIGGIIALVIGVSELRKFLENWMFYRTITELLKGEKYFYENNAEKYSNLDEDEKVQLLVERVESIAPVPPEKVAFIAYNIGVYESVQKFGGLITSGKITSNTDVDRVAESVLSLAVKYFHYLSTNK